MNYPHCLKVDCSLSIYSFVILPTNSIEGKQLTKRYNYVNFIVNNFFRLSNCTSIGFRDSCIYFAEGG